MIDTQCSQMLDDNWTMCKNQATHEVIEKEGEKTIIFWLCDECFQRYEDEKEGCDHSFVDADNEGFYGEEVCRFCGHKQKK